MTNVFEGVLLLVIFILVFTCSLVALARAEVFGTGSRVVISICVALLSALGLKTHVFVSESLGTELAQDRGGSGCWDWVLIPYAALPIALVLVLLLVLLSKLLRLGRRRNRGRYERMKDAIRDDRSGLLTPPKSDCRRYDSATTERPKARGVDQEIGRVRREGDRRFRC